VSTVIAPDRSPDDPAVAPAPSWPPGTGAAWASFDPPASLNAPLALPADFDTLFMRLSLLEVGHDNSTFPRESRFVNVRTTLNVTQSNCSSVSVCM